MLKRIFEFAVLLIVQAGLFAAQASAAVCHKSQSEVYLSKQAQVIRPMYNEIKAQLESVLSDRNMLSAFKGEAKPSWENYNEFKTIFQKISGLHNDSSAGSIMNTAEKAQLKKDLSGAIEGLATATKSAKQEKDQGDTAFSYNRMFDYHHAYFELAKVINQKLGVKIFPVHLIPKVKSNKELAADGAELIAELERKADEYIKKNGFENLEAFDRFIREKHPELIEFMEIADKKSVVAMHRPENARFWIPLAGLQNQRITGSSKGDFHDDSIPSGETSGRDIAESNLTHIPVDEYVKLSARFKPNYAEVRPELSVRSLMPNKGASGYGSDLWIIKKDVVKERATWTPMDSLGPGRTKSEDQSLNDIFLPWKYRILMANFRNIAPEDIFAKYAINKFQRWLQISDGLSHMKKWDNGANYFEVQIFGALSIKDVEAFVFQGTPPNKELYDLLVAEGIKVWDERTWPAVAYDGSESQ